MHVLPSILAYVGIVFGAGFLLGSIRVMLLVPNLGDRWAELLEAPFMAVVILTAGRWLAQRFNGADRTLFLIGFVAAGIVIAADLLVGVQLRGLSLAESVFSRDPVAGTVYYLLVLLFAIAPWAARRCRSGSMKG